MTIPPDTQGFPPRVTTKPAVAEANNVKTAMLTLMYEQATNADRPRVKNKSNNGMAVTGPLVNPQGFIGWGVVEFAKHVTAFMHRHVNAHEVTHALYDLRDLGWVKFGISKRGSQGRSTPTSGTPIRIQLTHRGKKQALIRMSPTLTPPEDILPTPKDQQNGHAHISDADYPGETPVLDEDELVRGIIKDNPTSTQSAQREEWREAKREQRKRRKPSPGQETLDEVPGTPRGDGTFVPLALASYPLAAKAYLAHDLVTEAVALLEEAGLTAAAEIATDEMANRTPLEVEVATFVTDLTRAGAISAPSQQGGEAIDDTEL